MNSGKTVVILGSAREDSNTLKAVQLKSPFKNYEILALNKLKIDHFDYHNRPNDDFLDVVEKIISADNIVFATPVYWYSMSGLLKVFFDRLTELITTSKTLGRKLAGKNVYLVATGTEPELPSGFEVPFVLTCEYFHMNFMKSFYYASEQIEKTNVESHPLTNINNISIKAITALDHPKAQSFYQSVGYLQPIQPTDLVVIATLNSKIIGVVRLAREDGHTILRGMQIAKEHQRHGVGSLMIKALEPHIGGADCYCLPHGWLEGFYGQIGFIKVADNQAPAHLQQRLVENKKKYPQLIVMKRPRSQVEIVYPTEKYFKSLHQTLDQVAKEKIYLEMIEAKPFDEVATFQSKLVSNNWPVYYAIKNNDVVGWADITPASNPRLSHRGFLGMGLLKEYRGQGLGTQLLQKTLIHAKRIGLEKVELTVYTNNTAAIHLYKKCGFTEIGIIKNYRKLNGLYFDCLEMEMFL